MVDNSTTSPEQAKAAAELLSKYGPQLSPFT